ncbi:hypothetical protein DPMN_138642 [Dreissena polymorpha]|uniref:Chitin-binding type-2 domain-containing protein n=2 Tax=Dreissena polymorpha TaxID=45954 RepID=A0A9D4G4V7_DREPO|nr:hypothetical protein DPMN_138642 [Dreissena polymorpha]
MPSKAIEKQQMPYEDILKCEGNMGYPAQELTLEVYDNITESYRAFSWPSGSSNSQTEKAGCLTTALFSYHNLIFSLSDSGKLFRCSAYDRSPTPRFITSTSPQSLNVLANTCNSTGDYWEGSPSSCQLYARCASGVKYIYDCGAGSCHSIVDNSFRSCTAANCNNCTPN